MIQTISIFDQLAPYDVQMPKREEIETWLAQHPLLAEILPVICGNARRFFGPLVELSLELYQDPENNDRYLTLYLRQDNYDTGFMDRINTFSDEFDAQLADISGYFLITTDFRRRGMTNDV